MEASRTLFIPVILGTARMGRMSLHAARLVTEELGKCEGVETDLIDIAKLPLPTDDAGEAIKHADFSAKMNKADAVRADSPEYYHGYFVLLSTSWTVVPKNIFTRRLASWVCRPDRSVGLESFKTCCPSCGS